MLCVGISSNLWRSRMFERSLFLLHAIDLCGLVHTWTTRCIIGISALDMLHLHVLQVYKFLLHSNLTVERLRLKQVYSWTNWPANSLFRSTEELNSTVHKSTANLKGLWVTVTWRASDVQTVTYCFVILCSWSTVGIDTAGPASKGMDNAHYSLLLVMLLIVNLFPKCLIQ